MKRFNWLVLTFILLIVPSLSQAKNSIQVFGDWEVDLIYISKVPFSIAVTTNDSDSSLGVICMGKNDGCIPFINNQLSCEEQAKYPALVYVDSGLVSINMECLQLGDLDLFVLPDEHLEYIITNNKYSVAFGVKGGKFRAVYFSLNGSAKALIEAKRLINSVAPPTYEEKKKKSKYKDTVL